jgi:sugar-specific transcriptional regulator TrmB
MYESTAVDGLTELGLSTYAARTFVGLQKLGVASASEVAEVVDVPRSQVYGATDELEELGLVDVQESSPKRYRAVEVSEARDLLFGRLESHGEAAFEYLDSVRGERATTEETSEAIWTTDGRANVTRRVTSLVGEAEDSVVFATSDPGLLDGAVLDALTAREAEGVAVVVASAVPAVRDLAVDAGVEAVAVEDDTTVNVGRVLVTDDDTVLLSVAGPTDGAAPAADSPAADADGESAFWTAGTGFASVLARLVRDQFP